jgi:putative transposase
MVVNAAGRLVRQTWEAMPGAHPEMDTDELVVMPNHVHAIVVLWGGTKLGSVIRAFKARVTRAVPRPGGVWQAGYYDRVIRE